MKNKKITALAAVPALLICLGACTTTGGERGHSTDPVGYGANAVFD